MSNEKEIGGYFELGGLVKNEWHNGCLKLNSARNCLRYVIRRKKIKKVNLPYLLCDSMANACRKENIEVSFYHIDDEFTPVMDDTMLDGEYICIVNHYGLLDNNKLSSLKDKYKNVIIDNTQSFFQIPIADVDTIYNCRKYFGVPDGAYLFSDLKKNDLDISIDISKDRIGHLVGRLEVGASEYYRDFVEMEELFNDEDVKKMSKLTDVLMGAIDYNATINIRRKNIAYIHEKIGKYNKLQLNIDNMSFMYPFYVDNSEEIRKELIKNKIYVPLLWPNVLENSSDSLEYKYAKNIIPIPIDQRYDESDMKKIYEVLKGKI